MIRFAPTIDGVFNVTEHQIIILDTESLTEGMKALAVGINNTWKRCYDAASNTHRSYLFFF